MKVYPNGELGLVFHYSLQLVFHKLFSRGVHRVWVDDRPEVQERISEAVTRDDVRLLIVQKFIRKHQKKGISRGRAKVMAIQRTKGRRRGHGSRKGAGDRVLIVRGEGKSKSATIVAKVDRKARKIYVEGFTYFKSDGTELQRPIDPSNLVIIKSS